MRLGAVLVIAVALAGCGGDDDDTCRGPDGDLAKGATYVDGCNECTCNDDGSITCVEDTNCGACEYEGASYAIGDSWPAGDGCNFCQCLDVGDVSCTETACTN
jgi:hypothetical protein